MASFSNRYDTTLDYYNDDLPAGFPVIPEPKSWTVMMNLSRSIQPNTIDQFTITVGDSVLRTTLYYFQLGLRYNDDDRIITSEKIIMAIIGRPYFRRVIIPGMEVPEYDMNVVEMNRQVIKQFARLRGLWSETARKVVKSGGFDV